MRANVEPKSSIPIGEKVEISPKGFTLGVKVEIEKNLVNLPRVLINAELYGLVLAPRLKKGYPSNLRGQFATPGVNVLAFSSNLGPIRNPKILKVGPKFFWPCLLV